MMIRVPRKGQIVGLIQTKELTRVQENIEQYG